MIEISYWIATGCRVITVPKAQALTTVGDIRRHGGQIVHYVAVS